MRIYSVESKNLFFVNFIDFKIRTFSPRELFFSLIGIAMLFSSIRGEIAAIFGLLGIIIVLFGYVSYKFVPFEIQLADFILFHLRNNSAKKREKEEKSLLSSHGMPLKFDDDVTEKDVPKPAKMEPVRITNLDEPYTITLKTKTTQRFLPVSIYIDEILVTNTSTDRHGNVSCTALIEEYGIKRFRVIADDKITLYDDHVEFVP